MSKRSHSQVLLSLSIGIVSSLYHLLSVSGTVLAVGTDQVLPDTQQPSELNHPTFTIRSHLGGPELPPLDQIDVYIPAVLPDKYLLLDLSDRRVYLYQRGAVQDSYPVAIGRDGWETPTGRFEVEYMEHYPVWRHPGTGEVFPAGSSDNPLGVAWIEFWSDGQNSIGFHGTPDPSLIGQAVSHGCVRMKNKDVLMLFMNIQVGTIIQVVP
jgi:L,D-transpeptidase ErfK/SrfK